MKAVQRFNDKNEKWSTVRTKTEVKMKAEPPVQHLNGKNDKDLLIRKNTVVKMKAEEPPVQPCHPSFSKVKPPLGSATHAFVDQQREVSVPSNRECFSEQRVYCTSS